MDTNFPYDDIANLPHPTSKKHPRMSMEERAAQFSPFAALTGFGAVLQETGRLTGSRRGLTDSDIRQLEEQLTWLAEHEGEHPKITVTYFLPDERKEGGEYAMLTAPGPGGAGVAAGGGREGAHWGHPSAGNGRIRFA